MTVGIEPTVKSSSSVRFVQPDGSVRFGFGCQNLWVRSVRFEMVLEWCSSSVCSARVRFDSHLYWQIKLSPTKSCVLRLHVVSGSATCADSNFLYHIDNVALPVVNFVTELGVT